MTDRTLPADFDFVVNIPYIGGILQMAAAAPGEYLEKLNTIIDFVESGCRPPWFVYMQTLAPALGEAVLVLLGFDQWDVARAYLRPAGLRSRKRFRHGKKKKGRLPEIPELGELIGKKIPGGKIVRARRMMPGERYLWVVDGVMQRALWWWLVIDLVVETAYQWASNLMESKWCSCPDNSGFDVTSLPQTWGAHADWRVLAATGGDRGEFPFQWRMSYAELERHGGILEADFVVRRVLPRTTVELTIGISSAPNQPPDLDRVTLWVTPGSPPQEVILFARLPGPGRYYITYATPGEGSIMVDDLAIRGRVLCPEAPKQGGKQ